MGNQKSSQHLSQESKDILEKNQIRRDSQKMDSQFIITKKLPPQIPNYHEFKNIILYSPDNRQLTFKDFTQNEKKITKRHSQTDLRSSDFIEELVSKPKKQQRSSMFGFGKLSNKQSLTAEDSSKYAESKVTIDIESLKSSQIKIEEQKNKLDEIKEEQNTKKLNMDQQVINQEDLVPTKKLNIDQQVIKQEDIVPRKIQFQSSNEIRIQQQNQIKHENEQQQAVQELSNKQNNQSTNQNQVLDFLKDQNQECQINQVINSQEISKDQEQQSISIDQLNDKQQINEELQLNQEQQLNEELQLNQEQQLNEELQLNEQKQVNDQKQLNQECQLNEEQQLNQEKQLNEEQTEQQYFQQQNEAENKKDNLDQKQQKDDCMILSKFNHKMLTEIQQKLIIITESTDSSFQSVYQDLKSETQLQISMKFYMTAKKHKVSVVKSQYILPCEPIDFVKFMADEQEQLAFDKNLEKFQVIDNIQDGQNVYLLSYKKIPSADQRYFVYFKNSQQIDENTYVETQMSVFDQKYDHHVPQKKNITRGNIILSGNVVRKIAPNQCQVKSYSEIDSFINLPEMVMKSLTQKELKGFVQKTNKKFQDLLKN